MRAGGELGGGQEGECARARLPCCVLVYRRSELGKRMFGRWRI